MFFCGYRNEIEPLCWSFEQFAIFFLWVVSFSHLGPIWAYVRVFWCPTTLQNPPVELKPWFYVLLWGREQKRSFVSDLWAIGDFFTCEWSFLSFWACMGLFQGIFGSYTPLNPPTQLKFLVYVVVLVREKNRASILKFWPICKFFPVGGLFLTFWPYLPPPHTPPLTKLHD